MVNAVLASLVVLGALPGGDPYLAAHNAERAGKLKQAIESYNACAAADPSLAPYARVSAARCLSASGNRPAAIASLRAVLAESPEGPWTLMAQLHLAGLLALDSHFAEASALYAKALDVAPKTWIFEQYDWAAAETYVQTPEFQPRAYAYFREKVATTVLRQRRVDAARYLAKSPDLEDRLLALYGLIKSAESTDAWKLAVQLMPECATPRDPINLKALEPLLTSNKKPLTDAQREAFLQTVNAHDDSRWMRLFLAHLARSHTSIGEPKTAQLACDMMLKHFQDAEETGETLYWLANRLARDEKRKEAAEQYLRLAKQCPNHARADAALLAAAVLQREVGDAKAAVKSLELLVEKYPQSRHASNAWFWLGKHREAAGHKKDAAKAFKNAAEFGTGDYYAHCAAHSLAQFGETVANGRNLRLDGAGAYMAPFAMDAIPCPEVPAEILADPQIERLMFFGRHGLEEGEWEAFHLGRRLTGGPNDAPIYQVMSEAGLAKAAMDFAQAAEWGIENGKPTTARLRIEFPRAYWTHVCDKCDGTGIDPYLVLAIARQESTFRPALTSHAGACGLMQVMPPTAQWLAKVDPNIDPGCIANLDNPNNSLQLGTRYLLRMIERSSGNLVHALASYNAGPGNCSKWLKRWPNANPQDFVENIPFGETRNYVKAVLGGYAAYHSLYPPAE